MIKSMNVPDHLKNGESRRILSRLEDFLFNSKTSHFLITLIIILLFKVGIWHMPNLSYSQFISKNPFSNPFQGVEMYIFWNWLGPFLAWSFGLQTMASFFLFHLTCSFLFIFVLIRLVFQTFPNPIARQSLIILFALPAAGTSFFWVGMDSLTLLLIALPFVFPKTKSIALIMGALLGMQHFEQGIAAYSALFFAVLLSHKLGYRLRYSPQFCLSLLVGVLAGRLALSSIFHFHHIQLQFGRHTWLSENLPKLLQQFIFHFQMILWSTLGLGWFVAIRFADWGKSSLPFFISLSSLLLLLPLVEDQTRVSSIISFPLILVFWLLNQDFIAKLSRREISLFFLAWIVSPWTWVWGGITRVSAFSYDLAYLLHDAFGWFELPSDLSAWPFF